MRLDIDAPGTAIERVEIHRADNAACRAGEREPREAGGNRGADRRIKPQSVAAWPNGHSR
jgi:hypothetical protein